MAGKKSTRKQADSDSKVSDIAEQLEHAFMAGLGALSDAQKKGAKKFPPNHNLVRHGQAL